MENRSARSMEDAKEKNSLASSAGNSRYTDREESEDEKRKKMSPRSLPILQLVL